MPPKRNQKKGGSSQASKQPSKATSKVASRQNTPLVPGTPAEPVVEDLGTHIVGINFGQTASSIALINKEGRAECITNDDGDRQIATAISFAGDQVYVGNTAKTQLVRNSNNTILGFRDFIGKTYDEVKSTPALYNSAPVVDKDGQPAFSVVVNETPTVLTVTDIATRYLCTLVGYATDFSGHKIDACVVSVPDDFSTAQRDALRRILEESVGVKVLQFVNESGAAAIAYSITTSNMAILDVGGRSARASVVAARHGMLVPLASARDDQCGGDQLDAVLVDFFSKEFTKKTKVTWDTTNHRAMMKLRLAAEVTKRSLSASHTANCSVESLADGMDFNGSVNRMRFDLLAGKVFAKIVKLVDDVVHQSGLSKESIDEVILIGGSTKLVAISERVASALHPEVKLTNSIESDEVVAMGCALQAQSIVVEHPLESPEQVKEFETGISSEKVLETLCLSKPLGLVVPVPPRTPRAVDGKQFVVLADAMSPLPFRTVVEISVAAGSGKDGVVIDLWQGEHDVKVDVPPKKKEVNGVTSTPNDDDDDGGDNEDDDDEDEDEEVRTAIVRPVGVVAHLDVSGAQSGKTVTLNLLVDEHGRGRLSARASGASSDVSVEFGV